MPTSCRPWGKSASHLSVALLLPRRDGQACDESRVHIAGWDESGLGRNTLAIISIQTILKSTGNMTDKPEEYGQSTSEVRQGYVLLLVSRWFELNGVEKAVVGPGFKILLLLISLAPCSHQIDVLKLEKYLLNHIPGLKLPLQVSQFKLGQSNPTYLLNDAAYVTDMHSTIPFPNTWDHGYTCTEESQFTYPSLSAASTSQRK
ncbi:hypothetical protein BC936DRAFT_139803 [Jimgerdemannia flammicorona]|uniref:Uncharacterized protein n=1 Tax=Jimgerdemannia flammicorona TaxID=994334 RepID=A0A433B981_9FUNG|nr:hypothetical protein BC936DRAFT_139803 [Jimgerdemannia flammicorona]